MGARLLVTHVCADFLALTPATRRSRFRVGLGPALPHERHLAAHTSRGGAGRVTLGPVAPYIYLSTATVG